MERVFPLTFHSSSWMLLSKTASNIFNRKEQYCLLEETCSKLLSFCNANSFKEGICSHTPIIKLALHYNLYLNNNLLSLYAKSYGVGQARHFFDEMPDRDVVSWTGILSAYVKNSCHREALELFSDMIDYGQYPNEFTLSCVLRSCSALREFSYGAQVHTFIVKLGFEPNPILSSNMIDLYASCDFIKEAYRLFTSMDNGDVVAWTTMISSLVQAQKWSRALQLYVQMIEAAIPPNEFTFVKLLGASCSLGLCYGKLLHAHLIMFGIKMNLILKTALVDMYFKCQQLEDAIRVSTQTSEYDVLLWTTIISGLAQNLRVSEAVYVLRDMEMSGILPNNFTYSTLLNASSSILSLYLGEQIHSRVIAVGLEGDVFVGNALVDMYTKCSDKLANALRAFRGITAPNVVTWTSLIVGFAEHGYEEYAFLSFAEMRAAEVHPNSVTLSNILGTCRRTGCHGQIPELHAYIIKTKEDHDLSVGNALVDAYAGIGMIYDARSVIRTFTHQDPTSYTRLATRLNQMGYHELALEVITYMFRDGVKLDGFNLASFLSASAGLNSLRIGTQLHCYSVKSGLESSISVSNGLIDLYGKCGCMNDALRSFQEMSKRDAVSWNALISILVTNGHISSALSAFDDMRLVGLEPDSVTFLSVISACGRGGLFDLGVEYFQSMKSKYDIAPQLDHYECLVDLLGRAGRLEQAMEVINTMPFKPDPLIFKTLLRSSILHKNLTLGEDMAMRGLELNPSDPSFYLLLAKLYENSGEHDLGEETLKAMREKGLRIRPGQCWMETKSNIHYFTTGDISHPEIDEIGEKLRSLVTEFRNRRYSYQEKGDKTYHCEQMAVAFGLLRNPTMVPIRITKNSHICLHCHTFIMLVTQVVDTEIIIKDGNRFHIFKKGECSCGRCRS